MNIVIEGMICDTGMFFHFLGFIFCLDFTLKVETNEKEGVFLYRGTLGMANIPRFKKYLFFFIGLYL